MTAPESLNAIAPYAVLLVTLACTFALLRLVEEIDDAS